LVELVDFASFYLNDEITIDPKAAAKFLKPEIAPPLEALAAELESLDKNGFEAWATEAEKDRLTMEKLSWLNDGSGDEEVLLAKMAFERVLARFNLKLGQLAQPVRVALTGGTISPGIYEVIAVLGRNRTVTRLHSALAHCTAG
jgi:glutamyl-tRNA synthetase